MSSVSSGIVIHLVTSKPANFRDSTYSSTLILIYKQMTPNLNRNKLQHCRVNVTWFICNPSISPFVRVFLIFTVLTHFSSSETFFFFFLLFPLPDHFCRTLERMRTMTSPISSVAPPLSAVAPPLGNQQTCWPYPWQHPPVLPCPLQQDCMGWTCQSCQSSGC